MTTELPPNDNQMTINGHLINTYHFSFHCPVHHISACVYFTMMALPCDLGGTGIREFLSVLSVSL
jgi:hypothetical protein